VANRANTGATLGKDAGKRLRALRLARNMTQRELAGERYSVSYISAIERGRVRASLGVLEWCAQQLAVQLHELLGDPLVDASSREKTRQHMAQSAFEQVQAALLLTSGDLVAAMAALTDLHRKLGTAAPPPLHWYSAYVAARLGDLAGARRHFERYQRSSDESGRAAGRAGVRLLSGLIHVNSREHARAVEALREALEQAETAPVDLDFPFLAWSVLARVLAERSDGREAYEAHTGAIKTYERLANPMTRATDAEQLAREAAGAGDFVQAYGLLEQAWLSRREANMQRDVALLYVRRALLAVHLPPAARERDLRRALDLAKSAGTSDTEALAASCLVLLLAAGGAPEQAVQAAHSLPQGTDLTGIVGCMVHLACGWLAHVSGDMQAAQRYASTCMEELESSPFGGRTERAFAYAALSRLFEGLGDGEHAYAALKRAVALGMRSQGL
jgi:transcriptional regulator with XRE-family HTH domain